MTTETSPRENLTARKRELRSQIRQARAARSPREQHAAASEFTHQLARFVSDTDATTVACFYPLPGEPDTRGCLEWCFTHGIRALVPAARADRQLNWIEVTSLVTRPGLHGIPEPVGEVFAPAELTRAETVFVPAAAVDAQGVRLGWGGGYYDRALAQLDAAVPVVAVVFEDEFVADLPREPHDVPVAGVVTPKRIHMFGGVR